MGNPIGVSGTITGYGRPPDPNSVTGYRSACLYKGVVYNQGDTWEDGCDYDCECTDASAGKYICTERCQRFGSIPNGCSLVPDANDRCCQQVTCVPTAAATPGPNSGPCQDKLNNCYLYGKSSCTGQYLQWAQDNCAAYCGICGTTASTKCEDKIPNCVDFGSDSCSGGFTSWAEYNCPKTCGLCGTTTVNPINVGGFTNPPSGGISPGTSQCVDKLPNCASYGDDSCRSPYEKWALENCPARCNLCSQLIAGGGTAGGNTGFNPGSFTIDPNAGVVTGVGAAGCYYKGKLYQQGEDWQDGCLYNCTCQDGTNGFYRCVDRCPTYNFLPQGCSLVKPPGACCAQPQCVGAGGQITSNLTQGCLYKGQLYTQGQTWDDGCVSKCTCVDGTIGQYQCNDKCIQWNLPSVCTLNPPAAGKCCKTPNCPANVKIQYPPGYTEQ